MAINQVAPRRLADTIVEQLETMILEGTLQPGQRLPPERVLAEPFGVSRPSLREAIQRLATKGLLISRQGGGNYVTETLGASFSDPLIKLLESHPEAHRDLLEFRRTLEADCAVYAAKRATEMDRDYVTQAWQGLIDQHSQLYRAIIEGRADDARAIAGHHIEFVQQTISEHSENQRRRERSLRRERHNADEQA